MGHVVPAKDKEGRISAITGKTKGADTLNIAWDSDGSVFISDKDYDTMLRTQRQIVDLCRAHDRWLTHSREVGEQFTNAIGEIRAWCEAHQDVAACVLAPRMDDLIVILMARSEDDGGLLHDQMSEFDLEMFSRNDLRLYWMLLRRSEWEGLSAFADTNTIRVIYRADKKGS